MNKKWNEMNRRMKRDEYKVKWIQRVKRDELKMKWILRMSRDE